LLTLEKILLEDIFWYQDLHYSIRRYLDNICTNEISPDR
jgi:hypothetical protein